jgi:hypothetical protein
VRADELPHAPLPSHDWYETWALELHTTDASFGAHLAVTLRPDEGVTWFWAAVAGRDRRLVAVVDHEVPLPRHDRLELRTSGLWLDIEVEEPGERVTVGMEAFGLAFDDPFDAVGDALGARTPVGFDLEWERAGRAPDTAPERYAMTCTVVGEILVGDEQIEVDALGARSHCWGIAPWWRRPAVWFGGRPDAGAAEVERVAAAPVPVVPGDPHGAIVDAALVAVDGGAGALAAGWRHRIVPSR